MKIRKGKSRYQLPPIGELLHVHLDESTKQEPMPKRVLMRALPEDILQPKRRGRPTHFAIVHGYGGTEIRLYPTPDDAAQLVVRYFPPAREI